MNRLLAGQVAAVIVLLALLSPHVAGASNQWPMYKGNPSHTGFILVSLDPTKFALRWVRNFGYRLSPVVASGDRAFVCANRNLYGLDSDSGQNIWSTDFGSLFPSDLPVSAASPSYSDGKIYIETASSGARTLLCAYDAATGALMFKTNVGPGDSSDTFCAPTIFKGKVYIEGIWSNRYIYSFDGSSGNEDWSFAQSSNAGSTPAVDEDRVYIYSGYCPPGDNPVWYNILYAADRLTGRLVFEIPVSAPLGMGGPYSYTPVLGGLSDLFVISGGQLIRFDLNARSVSWVKSGYFTHQPTVANGMVYAINNGTLGAYDQTTGTLQWTWNAPNYDNVQGTIVATNSHLFVTSSFNTYCIDLNTHQAVWSYPAAGILSLGESTLYISCWDGTLTAISLGIPDIYVPETVDFANADLGQTVTRTIPVSNVGDAPLEVQSIRSSSEEFAVQSLVLPIAIGPHQSVPVDVQFTPVAGGPGSANLLVSSTDPDEPETTAVLKIYHSITASANAGGQISPSSTISVPDEDSFSFVITPNPGYQLASLILDGVTVANPSTSAVTYTFDNVTTDHTITAVFARYFDYFGTQAGDRFESLVTYTNGTSATGTDDISFDTQSSCILDTGLQNGIQIQNWMLAASNLLLLQKQQEAGITVAYAPPLPVINAPLAKKAHWTGTSTASENGVSVTVKFAARVSHQVLVSVPAGHFLAWPIAYHLKASNRGRTMSTSWKTWFAPYIGTVKNKDSKSTTVLTAFSVGAGTVSTPPPVVTGVSPASAPLGSQITVNGYQFGASQGSSVVKIGSVDCEIVSWSDTQIQCIVPETASPAPVKVITDTWTSNDSALLKIPPQITNVTPASGNRGSTVQIAGTNFGDAQGKVKLGSTRVTVTQWADTSISFTVPANIRCVTYGVKVVNSQGRSVLPEAFTVTR